MKPIADGVDGGELMTAEEVITVELNLITQSETETSPSLSTTPSSLSTKSTPPRRQAQLKPDTMPKLREALPALTD
ncbi:hypothetical protein F2Q70_00023073 [Brassica cretica]|uniref:Uncharacterized protein n=1 Tax=Brassica cretica TaxID=69181 RepID=A0A8S9GR46_BRACR|nr:hypothetical protein F2Q70_00023073 [Brassica cretica]